MTIAFLAFLLGILSGLRAFMSLVAVAWATRLHRLHVETTRLAFLGYAATPFVSTALAVIEFITDQLPSTASRKVAKQFIPRLLLSLLAGTALGVASGSLFVCIISSLFGAVAGTYGGASARRAMARMFGNDRPAALLEDCVAIVLAIDIVVSI